MPAPGGAHISIAGSGQPLAVQPLPAPARTQPGFLQPTCTIPARAHSIMLCTAVCAGAEIPRQRTLVEDHVLDSLGVRARRPLRLLPVRHRPPSPPVPD